MATTSAGTLQLLVSDAGDEVVGGLGQCGLDEVHRRAADEAGDEEVDRPVEHRLGIARLLEHAAPQNGDPVTHRHRLDLIVRHVDRRDAEVTLHACDLTAHLHAQARVEVRQRLVHQEHPRLAHDRASHRDALALSAGELTRLPFEEVVEAEGAARALDALLDVRLRRVARPQAEGDVLEHRHVRVERVVLEDHRDVALGAGRGR